MANAKYKYKYKYKYNTAPPKVVELVRMANPIIGIVTSDGLGVTMGALFKLYMMLAFALIFVSF